MGSELPARLFLDSGVLIDGLVAPWSDARAILILARRKIVRVIIAEIVRREVENDLLRRIEDDEHAAGQLIDVYSTFLARVGVETVPLPSKTDVRQHRALIRHAADVPVLLSALRCRPDWFITGNVRHFTPQLARRTGLRIATPHQVLNQLQVVE